MSLMDYIRRRSLLNPAPPMASFGLNTADVADAADSSYQPPAQVDDPSNAQNTQDPYDRAKLQYNKLLEANTPPAQKQYRDFLDTGMPSRDDPNFKPTKMSRVGSILAGVSQGIRSGGAVGYKAASDILDQPYDESINDWKLKADRLRGAADIEERDINNKVKTLRDILQDDQSTAKNVTANRGLDIRQNDITARTQDRAADRQRRGWNYFTDPNGERIGVNAATGDRKDLGKGGMSTADKLQFNTNNATNVAKARQPFEIAKIEAKANEVRTNIDKRLKNTKELIQFKQDNPNFQYKTLDNGDIIALDPSNPFNIQHTGWNTGQLSQKEKAELGLKNAKELKQTPGAAPPDKTTTTELTPDGKKKIVTTKSTPAKTDAKTEDLTKKAPPAGAKPGGKWIMTKFGPVYQEP
jgi:hypothetical protein